MAAAAKCALKPEVMMIIIITMIKVFYEVMRVRGDEKFVIFWGDRFFSLLKKVYSPQLEQPLKGKAEIAESLSFLHRLSYTRYNMFSSVVSIPIIVISNITGYMTARDMENSSIFSVP